MRKSFLSFSVFFLSVAPLCTFTSIGFVPNNKIHKEKSKKKVKNSNHAKVRVCVLCRVRSLLLFSTTSYSICDKKYFIQFFICVARLLLQLWLRFFLQFHVNDVLFSDWPMPIECAHIHYAAWLHFAIIVNSFGRWFFCGNLITDRRSICYYYLRYLKHNGMEIIT